MTPDTIEPEITIDAPVERVWSILTQAEHIAGWFADAGAKIDLRPGGALEMAWAEHGSTVARVEVVEPPHRFAYRWKAHDAGQDEQPGEGNSTLVEFTLTPEGDGTRLRVHESGFAALAYPEERRKANHDDNTDGWAEMTRRAAEYAERVAA